MIDMISRQDAIDSPVKMVSEGLEWIPVYHIKELPSAEPEIIRCKDCKHYALEAGDDSYALGYCPFIGSHLVMSKGFCAWGERREECTP